MACALGALAKPMRGRQGPVDLWRGVAGLLDAAVGDRAVSGVRGVRVCAGHQPPVLPLPEYLPKQRANCSGCSGKAIAQAYHPAPWYTGNLNCFGDPTFFPAGGEKG